jgi:hypothetical protein
VDVVVALSGNLVLDPPQFEIGDSHLFLRNPLTRSEQGLKLRIADWRASAMWRTRVALLDGFRDSLG